MWRRNLVKYGLGATGLTLIAQTMNGQQQGRQERLGSREQAMSSGGFSKARLDRMHEVMAGYIQKGDVPGMVTLLSRRGEVHVDAIGTKALGGAEPMQRDTIFRIASMTKPITAVAAMILVEESKVRLDEPVDRLLPELAARKVLTRLDGPLDDTVPARRPITVRDLLTFRMGIGLVLAPPDKYPILKAMHEQKVEIGPNLSTAPGADAWIRGLGTLPLMYQPGERWMYHTGSDALGVLIARASGQPLEKFFRERIFDPLGMKDTAFSVPAAKLGRLATCYNFNPATGKLAVFDEVRGGQWSHPPSFESGGGGLVSTVDDYLAFCKMMLNKGKSGGDRILSRLSVEMMTADQLTPDQKAVSGFFPGFFNNRGWGFGMSVITQRDNLSSVPGRFGWDGGFGTSGYSDPTEEMVGILMTQRTLDATGIALSTDFWNSAYQAIDD
jgi:CubicO group peptidase (beta-lactamase class C family)